MVNAPLVSGKRLERQPGVLDAIIDRNKADDIENVPTTKPGENIADSGTKEKDVGHILTVSGTVLPTVTGEMVTIDSTQAEYRLDGGGPLVRHVS
jgi:hypothetical protein